MAHYSSIPHAKPSLSDRYKIWATHWKIYNDESTI